MVRGPKGRNKPPQAGWPEGQPEFPSIGWPPVWEDGGELHKLRKVAIHARDPREGPAAGMRKRKTRRRGPNPKRNNSPGEASSAQNATATIRQDKGQAPETRTRSKQKRYQIRGQYLQAGRMQQKKGPRQMPRSFKNPARVYRRRGRIMSHSQHEPTATTTAPTSAEDTSKISNSITAPNDSQRE